MSVCLPVCLCLFVCSSASACLTVWLSGWLAVSVLVFGWLPVCLYVCLPVCLSASLFVCISVCLFLPRYLYEICLSPFVCLSPWIVFTLASLPFCLLTSPPACCLRTLVFIDQSIHRSIEACASIPNGWRTESIALFSSVSLAEFCCQRRCCVILTFTTVLAV